MFDALRDVDDIPEVDLSEQRVSEMLGDIKRNSRNRRIAMVAPVVLAVAVLGAMIAAPPRHGGLASVADAGAPDPQLPRVFGSNGVWRLAEPIEESPASEPGPADVIQAPTEPTGPEFTLSPPDQEALQSLPASTSTPPMSTSGQTPDVAGQATGPTNPDDLDSSAFSAAVRVEASDSTAPLETVETADPTEIDPAEIDPSEAADTTDTVEIDDPVATSAESDAAAGSAEVLSPEETISTPDISSDDAAASTDEDVTVAVEEPLTEQQDPAQANPSTPSQDAVDVSEPMGQAASLPAVIVPRVPLVYSAHVSVTVQVVDDDSSVIDWCNTRVDWGDGSVSRVAGADDAALCTASCEYESTSSAASEFDTAQDRAAPSTIDQVITFEHEYTETIDARPRVFVATGDGCTYTLAELELQPFTVVPLS